MLNFFKNFLERKRKNELIIKSALQRKKINFIYRFLLSNYEIQLKDKIDFPAFHYATRDIEKIILTNQVGRAYQEANECLKIQFEKERKEAIK